MLYDAHNHLQSERFGGRQAKLLAECPEVARMVVNGCCEEDWPAVAALAEEFAQRCPEVVGSVAALTQLVKAASEL